MIRFTQTVNFIMKSRSLARTLIEKTASPLSCFITFPTHHYKFCTQTSITNIREVQQGRRFLQQKNINQAEQMYQRALNILPFFIQSNSAYNQQFSELLYEVITVHAWKGNLRSIQSLFTKYQKETSTQNKSVQNEKLNNLKLLLAFLGKSQYSFNQNQKLIAQRIKLAKQYSLQERYQVQKELCNLNKDKQPNSQNIQSWIHNQLRQTWLFIISSLLSRNNIYSNPNYNKVCNTLLKNTERSNAKNVIKPLILINSNLLRNIQYLQAEGILSYALDRKRENIRPQLLKYNQEYILLQLLLGRTMMGVERKSEGQKLFDEYRPRFNLQLFILQAYLLDSI